MIWIKSKRCETSACVEVAFPRCDTGSCVDVSFTSACDNVSCVEVGQAHNAVLVRDSKRPDQQPISFTPTQWSDLLQRVKAEDEINWDGVFFPLSFDEGEIEAFVSGAAAGEFDLPADGMRTSAGFELLPDADPSCYPPDAVDLPEVPA